MMSPGFTEEDSANFDGSFYSKTKGFLEEMLKSYSTTIKKIPISVWVKLLGIA